MRSLSRLEEISIVRALILSIAWWRRCSSGQKVLALFAGLATSSAAGLIIAVFIGPVWVLEFCFIVFAISFFAVVFKGVIN
jgi:hypothetical protein